MTSFEIDGILSTYGKDMPEYHYFKDKYALCLAAWEAGDGKKVAEVKRSRLAGLLQKDVLKQHCARHPVLKAADLLGNRSQQGWTFRQSLDTWGDDEVWSWTQVSRPGKSLVLRLDFGHEQDRRASQLRIGNALDLLEFRNHMHLQDSHNLAWVRMDLDWETGEVLIEEIQNDWLRTAKDLVVEDLGRDDHCYYRPKKAELKNHFRFLRYHEEVLEPIEKIWSEAMLCAALEFIRDHLGLHTVYMHTFECGTRLKDMGYNQPPRSLYQDLPKRFCFEHTAKAPAFLSRSWGQMQQEQDADSRARIARPFAFWKMEL